MKKVFFWGLKLIPFYFSTSRLEVRPFVKYIREGESGFTCTICDPEVELATLAEKEAHVQEAHRGLTVECELCNWATSRNSSKSSHKPAFVEHRLTNHGLATEGWRYYRCLEDDCSYFSHHVHKIVDHMLSKAHSSDGGEEGRKGSEVKFVGRQNRMGGTKLAPPTGTENAYKIPDIEFCYNDHKVKCRKCQICEELIPVLKIKSEDRIDVEGSGKKDKSIAGYFKQHCDDAHGGKMYKCFFCPRSGH